MGTEGVSVVTLSEGSVGRHLAECGGVLTMVTSPIDMVRLPKIEGPVVFREIEVVPDCKLEQG